MPPTSTPPVQFKKSFVAWKHKAVLPIEDIAIVGCGGNGSVFLTHLCRIHQAWVALGGQPFKIKLYDPDRVSESNLSRQVFCEADVGHHKATVLAQRVNAFYGMEVEPVTEVFKHTPSYSDAPSVIVGCVDNLAGRRVMQAASKIKTYRRKQWGETTEEHEPGCYWLDLGNSNTIGQVILGGHGLPDFFDVFPSLVKAKEKKNEPSCSVAESLQRQDLFINSMIACLGAQLLWKLMRNGGLDHHGIWCNLGTGSMTPMPIK